MAIPRRTPHLLLAGLLMLVLAVSGCGGKDKPAVCTDVTNLESSISAVTKINVNQGALDQLKTALAQVQTDAQQLKTDAQAQYSSQIDAVDAAVASVKTTVDAAIASPSATSLAAAITSLQSLKAALSGMQSAVKSTC